MVVWFRHGKLGKSIRMIFSVAELKLIHSSGKPWRLGKDVRKKMHVPLGLLALFMNIIIEEGQRRRAKSTMKDITKS